MEKKTAIDWEVFDEMCAYNCSLDEIAKCFGMSQRELKSAVEAQKGKGYMSIRRWGVKRDLIKAQLKLAEKSATMAIWLSRHLLGWGNTEKQEERGSIQLKIERNYSGAQEQGGDRSE